MALTETVEGGVELSLPHQSLGNTYIELISEVVKDLPGVTRLDLRDNRLTDVGVQEIVEAICSMDGHRGIQVKQRATPHPPKNTVVLRGKGGGTYLPSLVLHFAGVRIASLPFHCDGVNVHVRIYNQKRP